MNVQLRTTMHTIRCSEHSGFTRKGRDGCINILQHTTLNAHPDKCTCTWICTQNDLQRDYSQQNLRAKRKESKGLTKTTKIITLYHKMHGTYRSSRSVRTTISTNHVVYIIASTADSLTFNSYSKEILNLNHLYSQLKPFKFST